MIASDVAVVPHIDRAGPAGSERDRQHGNRGQDRIH